ncbi:MAG: hypothetical protein ACJAUQ_002069 [Maribacter sp.]
MWSFKILRYPYASGWANRNTLIKFISSKIK